MYVFQFITCFYQIVSLHPKNTSVSYIGCAFFIKNKNLMMKKYIIF